MICSACDAPIAPDDFDNRYRGCDLCGWRMHHFCWIELLSIGELPCPTHEVPAVLFKNGKIKQPATVDFDAGHGGNIVGMAGDWEMS